MKPASSESGAILLYILIAIGLIAALTAVMSRGERANESTLTDQQAKVAAQEIIDYSNTLANAVQKLRLRGCTDTQISFESAALAEDYSNPNPGSDNCKVFSASGGSMNVIAMKPEWLDTNWSANGAFGKVFFSYPQCIDGVGSHEDPCVENSTDLVFIALFLKEEICIEMNKQLGIGSAGADPPGANSTSALFKGSYSGSLSTLSHEDINGKMAACVIDTAGSTVGAYMFYQVLLAR